MRKKTVSVILSLILSVSLLSGCALFQYDATRDYRQVVAEIESVTITDNSGQNKSFTSEKKTIYKYELVSMLNSTGQSLLQYGYTLERAVDYIIDQLVTRELILNEADAQIHFGNIAWGQAEENDVLEGIYNSIDAQLAAQRNDILSSRGEEIAENDSSDSTDSTDTTYPVQEEDEEGYYDHWSRQELIDEVIKNAKEEAQNNNAEFNEESFAEKIDEYSDYKLRAQLADYDARREQPWTPATTRYPGYYGTDAVKSLELEAMRRFMSSLKDMVDDDYRIDAKQRKEFKSELDELNKLGNEKGLHETYKALGATKLMQYLFGDSYRESLKIQLLQKQITDSVDVSREEVIAEYDSLLAEQVAKYSDYESFVTDITGGNVDPLLYYPNGDYYYVKHILVPFSDEQTAYLTQYKAGEGALKGADAIAKEKEKLGTQVKGFEHRDGENYGLPKTIDEIYADVTAEMAKVKGSLTESDRTFDRLIYKYNTDTGIFGKELGYQVKANLGDAEYDSTYMEEFARAADELYRAGVEGAISAPVATDYGVHILYLSKIIPDEGLTVKLDDYISYGKHDTVYGKLEEEARTTKINNMFTVWQNQKIGYYKTLSLTDAKGKEKPVINTYEKTYKDLKESK